MNNEQLKEAVLNSLDCALRNGYEDFVNDESLDVALDLANYNSDLEGYDPYELAKFVDLWKQTRKQKLETR